MRKTNALDLSLQAAFPVESDSDQGGRRNAYAKQEEHFHAVEREKRSF